MNATTTAIDPRRVAELLAAPFEAVAIHWKPAVVSGNRAMALPYLDARAVQDRLDSVVGVEGWQDHYEVLPDGSAVCSLRVRIGADWICKVDVGAPSEQPDEGDRRKAAFSDALKRAAVRLAQAQAEAAGARRGRAGAQRHPKPRRHAEAGSSAAARVR